MQQAHMGNSIKNDLWITDEEEVKDPDVLPELPGYHVLIRPVSVKSKTKGGIFIPDTYVLLAPKGRSKLGNHRGRSGKRNSSSLRKKPQYVKDIRANLYDVAG